MAPGTAVKASGTLDGDFEMTVKLDKPKQSKSALISFGDQPKGTYVGFLITYSCDVGTCDYNPFDWTIRNEDGEEFDQSFVDQFEPQLQSGKLRAGRKAKGYITYDLKPGTYYVEYVINMFDDESASWKFTLR